MKASDTQVDGDHYKTMGEFQPWDVLQHWLTPEEYRGYQKGVAIAYLARERAKGGNTDIKKAAHHLQKLIEVLDESGRRAKAARDYSRFKDAVLAMPGWKPWTGDPSDLPFKSFIIFKYEDGGVDYPAFYLDKDNFDFLLAGQFFPPGIRAVEYLASDEHLGCDVVF